MATVNFTSALNRFFPEIHSQQVEAESIFELVNALEGIYPGLKDYLVDEEGILRKHINIFVGDQLIQDRESLSDVIQHKDEVLIFQALSGG